MLLFVHITFKFEYMGQRITTFHLLLGMLVFQTIVKNELMWFGMGAFIANFNIQSLANVYHQLLRLLCP
jgi:hypothetical protein